MNDSTPRVAIVGGGLAGLAASVALVEAGCAVELFEARRQLGGRAASFDDGDDGQQVDYCQHVSMGCCTQLEHFCRTTQVADLFREDDTLHFIGPDGKRVDFAATVGLPAPLHLLPGLLRLDFLSFPDRLHAARLLMRLAAWEPGDSVLEPTVATWLAENGASPELTRRFFGTVLVSALGESLEHAALGPARQVFLDGFMRSAAAWKLRIPRVPLREIFHGRVAAWLESRGVTIHRSSLIQRVCMAGHRFTALDVGDASPRAFDACIVAVPWRRLAELLPSTIGAEWPDLALAKELRPSPITSAHLWFDKPITDLPHAVLVDRLSQWVFQHPVEANAENATPRHYVQVVISGSHELAQRRKDDVLRQVLDDLQAPFPAARMARLLDSRLVTDPHAVFSVRPGAERCRLAAETPIEGLYLAGDWTQTGWPATMEGAVRSGYLAASALLRDTGREPRPLVGDLPPSWLSRLLFTFDRPGDTRLPVSKR